MRMPNHDSRQDCRVIPFVRPVTNEDNVVTSSIAAVIAVTILHHEGESPEERLLEIIEASGEAEVLDVADALEVALRTLVLANTYTWRLKGGDPIESGTISYRVDRCRFKHEARFNQPDI